MCYCLRIVHCRPSSFDVNTTATPAAATPAAIAAPATTATDVPDVPTADANNVAATATRLITNSV